MVDLVFPLLLAVLSLDPVECVSAAGAAGSGAFHALGGSKGTTEVQFRDEGAEAIVMYSMLACVIGLGLFGLVYFLYRKVRKYLKIRNPSQNFMVDKEVKCPSGDAMMLFHVPNNASSYIKCGSESNCNKKELVAGFTAWYSCPVCAYRICSGCSSVDDKEISLDNVLVTKFDQDRAKGRFS